MLYIKALHVISMVAWFSGLFYLPRLFVYHALATDQISIDRFKIMEFKLYYYITTPAALLTAIFGIWLLSSNSAFYMHSIWMHIKLTLVIFLYAYHVYLGYLLQQFRHNLNRHSVRFYRILNEVPVIFLIAIVMLVIVKPFGVIAG